MEVLTEKINKLEQEKIKNTCLIFENNGGNSFVIIPHLGFFNEIEDIMDDTYYKIEFVNMDLNDIKNLIRKNPYKIIN